jgi:integrase
MAARKLPEGMVRRPDRRGFYADFTVGGRRVRDWLGTDFAAACEILAELKARAYRGDFGLLDNRYPITELRRAYLTHCRQHLEPATIRCYEDWLTPILDALKVVHVRQLTVPAILEYREACIEQGLSARTINGRVGALQTMLGWGVDPAKLIAANPIAGVKPLPHRPKDGRALTDDEARRLLDASPPHWRDIWYAFLVTGLRRGELEALRFTPEFLDWQAREVIVPAWLAKNDLARRIPMDPGLYDLLRRLEAGRSGRQPGKGRGKVTEARVAALFSTEHVFVTTTATPLHHGGNLWRAFVRCLQQAGIERETFGPDGRLISHVDIHSLRRTFATSLIASGADPKTVQELLGHKTLTMTMRLYAKIRPHTKREAVGRLPYAGHQPDTKAPAQQ